MLPETHALLAGERFRFVLRYSRPSASSYLLEVDTAHVPDSADMTAVRAFPGVGKHIFMIDNFYVFAQMNVP